MKSGCYAKLKVLQFSDNRERLLRHIIRALFPCGIEENDTLKSLRFKLSVVLMSFATLALAQSDAQKPVAQSEAQRSFEQLKTLAGTWRASVTTDPPQHEMGNETTTQVSLRVTSRGNALVH